MIMMMCKAHSHKDGSGHGDGVEGVEEGGEEMDVKSRFKSESPQLSRVRYKRRLKNEIPKQVIKVLAED